MTGKLLGAVLIMVGCGYCGFSLTAACKREERILRQLTQVLDYMQCELHFRLTPLPDLCKQAGNQYRNCVGKFFADLSDRLESHQSPDVSGCVTASLAARKDLPYKVVQTLELLGTSLGRFDVEGQIRGLESVRGHCKVELDRIAINREARLRGYQTLGLCTGAALVILFV